MGKPLLKIVWHSAKFIVRALLCLLLIGQLAVLWIVSHRAPTRLPPAVLSALSEVFAGQLSFTCREATIDNCGRIRLGGARLAHDQYPGDILYADLDFTPSWTDLLTGKLALKTMEARGRGTLGEQDGKAVCDDFVVRLTNSNGILIAQSAARVGSMVLRADLILPPTQLSAEQKWSLESDTSSYWNRSVAINCLQALRALEGCVVLNVSGPNHTAHLSADFIENPTSISSLPLTAKRGAVRATFDRSLRAQLHLQELRAWDATAHDAWVFVDSQGVINAYLADIKVDGLVRIKAHARGRWHDTAGQSFALSLSTDNSWAQASLAINDDLIALKDGYAHIAASDLVRFTPVAENARKIGVDLSGPIDLSGTEISWSKAGHLRGHGSFAFSKFGWNGISPSRVRPESALATFTGDFDFSTDKNRLSLRRLNLAGLCGEIEGGLRLDDAYVIRLNSTEGYPVNTSCLNGLLGDWWKDLWSRFDLSTTGTRPHADVLVKGKWGAAYAEKVVVRAQLENFGFMGGRFPSADLWVFTTPTHTTVRIDSAQGELDGRSAGGARGTIEWTSLKPEWNGQPRISVEGNIQPAFLLRLHDIKLATQLRDWKFPKPHVRLTVEPDLSLQLHLTAAETATVAGVDVENLVLDLTKNPSGSEIAIHATGGVSGGRTTVDLKGDMSRQNTLSISVIDWSRTGLMNLAARLQGRAPDKQTTKDKSNLMASYKGTFDLSAPWATEGEGYAVLADPHLKTVHLLGGLSEGLDALGLGFSSYPLEKAELTLHCRAGSAEVKRLDLTGPSASLKFKGNISLKDGTLDLSGQMKVSSSSFGPLALLNPNRLIASMINIYIGGNMRKPQISLKKPTK
jgi:hypothetical protein